MPPAIEFRDVSLTTPQGHTLLNRVSLTLEQGAVTAILGRSGSGKTTLLRTVNRMIDPTAGSVLVHGKEVTAVDPVVLRRGIGYVIQETGLFPHLTVERNAAIVLEAMGRPHADRTARARELLTSVGLDPQEYAARLPHQLSGGQRQRTGLARALAADPPILLMDEPFGALDPLTRAEMQDLLRALLGKLRKTVVIVTHDLDEALYLADRILLLEQGRVVADLTPQQFPQSNQPEVAAYRKAFHRGEGETSGGRS